MSATGNDEGQGSEAEQSWLRRQLVPIATLLFVIAITAVLFAFRDRVAELGNLGYLGAFLISLVGNGTVILPMPGMILLFALGAAFNPLLVGLASAAGGAIGELTGYAAGFSGRGIVRNNAAYNNAVRWVQKWGWMILFAFTVTPLPVDVVGVAAGALRFPLWKFLLTCFAGKAILYTGMALVGDWGWEAFVSSEFETKALWAAGGVGMAVLGLLLLALAIESWTWKRGR